MTPTQLADAARRSYNANESDPFFSNQQMFEWMYDAEMALCTESWVAKNTFETTTVAGTRSYAYPTNMIKVRRVTYDGERLDEITFREDDLLTGMQEDVSDQGRPVGFVDFDNVIFLRPTPDSAKELKIYGYVQPPAIPGATSTLTTPDEYHPMIKLFLLQQMSVKDKNYDGARYYGNLWETALIKSRRYEAMKKRGSRYRVVQNVDVLPTPILGTV